MLCGDWQMDPDTNGLVDGYAYYCSQVMIDGHRKGRTTSAGAKRPIAAATLTSALIMAILNA